MDTEEIYTRITQELVSPYGKTFTWSVKSKMMGRTAPEAAQILIDVRWPERPHSSSITTPSHCQQTIAQGEVILMVRDIH